MEKEEIEKAAHEYAAKGVQGVSIFSAILAMRKETGFQAGATWVLSSSSNGNKKERDYAAKRFAGDNIDVQKAFIDGSK